MKKLFLICCLVVFNFLSNAQERTGIEQFIPTNSPDAKAFSETQFLPINDYNGKPNITIPIYEISFGGIKIPIQLTYNYGGVKVNGIASSVGTNWSLFAGGSVVREVNGLNDFSYTAGNSAGYMRIPTIDTENGCPDNIYREGEPDLYKVRAPGINTSFITISPSPFDEPTNDVECKEINKLGNRISLTSGYYNSALNVVPPPTASFTGVDFEPIKVEVVNTNGLKYSFEDLSLNSTISQQTEWVDGIDYSDPVSTDVWISSINLSSIFDPITGKTVDFEYSLPYNQNEFDIVKGVFRPNGSLSTKITQFQTTKSKRLSKIIFDLGTVEFFYDFVRLDIKDTNNYAINNNALTRILIKNNHGQIIKDARFNYSNVSSVEDCADFNCYRLFLDSIEFFGAEGGTLPGYDFTYNSTKLPKRYSYKQDFLGFSNGAIANPEPTIAGHYVPKTYHYPNQGVDSFLPVDIGNSNYQELGGNYSLASNTAYAKAGVLEKITYPTGGYTILTSESNQFTYLGTVINGGGLRIKKQELFNDDNTLKRSINYEYQLSNGTTSGFITYMPKFNDYKIVSTNDDFGLRIYQTDMANQKITNSSFIGYERVKITESGNGYTVKEYTTPNDYPNILGSGGTSIPGTATNPGNPAQYGMPLSIINQKIANGCFPTIVTDRDLLRGTLTNVSFFKEDNSLLKKTAYTYDYKEYESIGVGNAIVYVDENSDGCDPHAYLSEGASIRIARNTKQTTVDYSYLDGETHIVNSSFIYEDEYPFIKEKLIENSKRDVITEKYVYPYNIGYDYPISEKFICPPFEFLDELVSQNRIANPIITNTYQYSTDLINSSIVVYKQFYNKKYDIRGNPIPGSETLVSESPFLEKQVLGKTEDLINILNENTNPVPLGAPPQDICEITSENVQYLVHLYDSNGNPLEVSENQYSPHTILIWGYNKEYLIGKISNASLIGIPALLQAEINAISAISDNEHTTTEENEIRNRLQIVMENPYFTDGYLTSYTYDPLIGVTSSTDPRGRTMYYHYDEFNRLEFVTDNDGKVLSKNEYNYIN